MLVGYRRVSFGSDRQTTNLQRDVLMAVGVDRRHLFEDHALGLLPLFSRILTFTLGERSLCLTAFERRLTAQP